MTAVLRNLYNNQYSFAPAGRFFQKTATNEKNDEEKNPKQTIVQLHNDH